MSAAPRAVSELLLVSPRPDTDDAFRELARRLEPVVAPVPVRLLPLTDETRGSIDRARIRALAPGSLLVVASRGGIVNEGAVLEAVRDGHLAGAAFDVFAEEPLPPDSPLWDEPGVLVTPHVAGTTDRFMEHTAGIVERIWRGYWQGADPEVLEPYLYRSPYQGRSDRPG